MSTDAISSLGSAGAVSDLYSRRLDAVSLGGGLPRGLSSLPQAEQTKAVAGQFEAILLRQFLNESVGNLMGGEKGGASGNVYGYMLTDILATKLSEGGGLGLGRIMQQQLSPRANPHAVTPLSKK